LLLAVPGQFLRALIKSIVGHIKQKVILLNVAKALEQGTNKARLWKPIILAELCSSLTFAFYRFFQNLSEVVTEEMELCKYPYWFAALSGGMIAEEGTTKHFGGSFWDRRWLNTTFSCSHSILAHRC
jgi:hypothetical protein